MTTAAGKARRLLQAVSAVVLAYPMFAVALGRAMRLPWAQQRVTVFNRRIVNPILGSVLVHRFGLLAEVEHIGRRSGRSYTTPVLAARFDDGFVVPLVYGARSDWYRNVMSARTAAVVRRNRRYVVDRPEVLSLGQSAAAYPPSVRLLFRLAGIDRHVWLHQKRG